MKKILLGILLAAVLFIGTWFVVNLWPRPMEPPLWTEADLYIPEEKDRNGYYHLVALRDRPDLDDLDILDELYDVLPSKFPESDADVASYWAETSKLKSVLSDFLGKRSEALEAYRRLLELGQFIDQDPVTLSTQRKAPWILMFDLRKVAVLETVHSLLVGNEEQAYDLWVKTFRLDQAWLSSARSLLSHVAALRAVQNDLIVLSYLRVFPPDRNREAVLQAVSDFDPDRIGFRRAVVSEYLFIQSSADAVISEQLSRDNFWVRAVFNRSLFRRELNDLFRRLESGRFEGDMPDLGSGPLWWFYNPGGKLLWRLTAINWSKNLQDFLGTKEELQSRRSRLLTQGFPDRPLVLPPPEPPAPEVSEASGPPMPADSFPRGFSLEAQLRKSPDEMIRKSISRKAFREELENVDRLYTSIRVVPFFSEGKAQGLKFLSLKPGTLMERIGFQRGDVLLAVDGIPMDIKNGLALFDLSQLETKKKDYLIFRKGKFVRISAVFSGD